ncbi:MAG: hypothetical protein IKS19_01395 [Clostridia bacterium]|nr:hypothetical protein [Clostridia bacterium]
MKKLICVLLALCLCLSLAFAVSAQEGNKEISYEQLMEMLSQIGEDGSISEDQLDQIIGEDYNADGYDYNQIYELYFDENDAGETDDINAEIFDYGQIYDLNAKTEKRPFNFALAIVISLGIGLLVALIATSVMSSKMKTVHAQTTAEKYSVHGSLNLIEKADAFMNKSVDRMMLPQNMQPPRPNGPGR